MLIFLLSLTGIPATGGFMGKFFVFGAAVQHQYFWLVVVALINVGISAFYYLNVVRAMFFTADTEAEERERCIAAQPSFCRRDSGADHHLTLCRGHTLDRALPTERHRLGQQWIAVPADIEPIAIELISGECRRRVYAAGIFCIDGACGAACEYASGCPA